MPRIGCTAASLRDPIQSLNTLIGLEEAVFCDGSECGFTVFSEDGELELLRLHWHMVVSGTEPESGPRRFPIWGRMNPKNWPRGSPRRTRRSSGNAGKHLIWEDRNELESCYRGTDRRGGEHICVRIALFIPNERRSRGSRRVFSGCGNEGSPNPRSFSSLKIFCSL